MKLLKEFATFEYDKEDAKEAIKKDAPLILKGVLQRADTLNQNGRVYPKSILVKELKNYQRLIDEDRAFGELDHADSPIVNLKNLSHAIREIYMDEGGVVHGKVEILDTPNGNIIKAIIKAGFRPGISSRALGSLRKEKDYNVVEDDLQLICWDFVSEPSTPGAFMKLAEAKEISESELKNILTKNDRIFRTASQVLDLAKRGK